MLNSRDYSDVGIYLIDGFLPSLFINEGTREIHSPVLMDGRYESGVYIPSPDWSPINESTTTQLLERGIDGRAYGCSIGLFKCPNNLLDYFYKLYLENIDAQSIMREREILNAGVLEQFTAYFDSTLLAKLFTVFEERIDLRAISVQPPKKSYSSVWDDRQERYRGLHVDNWSKPQLSVMNRCLSGVRIGVNLGVEFRDVLFVDCSLSAMIRAIEDTGEIDVQSMRRLTWAAPIAERFLSLFPGHPVVKIRLVPGAGYIMPVENIVVFPRFLDTLSR